MKRSTWVWAVVSCGGVGFVPWAPGTAGALVGTAVALVTEGSPLGQWGILIGALAAGLWLIPIAQRLRGAPDPHEIVLDEFCGMLLTFIGLPLVPVVLITGFLAFRLFDIWKPPPIRQLERLPGAWGVLADDLAAGLLAHLVARLALLVF